MIRVEGKPLEGVDKLGERASQILSLIDFGRQWIEWALANPTDTFSFADQPALLEGIQRGLHGSPLVIVPRLGLAAAPLRLLELDTADLRTLVAFARDGGGPGEREVRQMLARNGLKTAADLASARERIEALGVGNAAVFQLDLALSDQIALCELFEAGGEDEVSAPQREKAAAFAVELATSLPAFVDYYSIYLALGASKLETRATDIVDELRPNLLDKLKCPLLSSTPTPKQLSAIVVGFLEGGESIGFSRLSSAQRQVVAHGGYRGESGEAAARVVASHWRDLQAFFRRQQVSSLSVTQDGQKRRYRCQSGGATALLELDARNLLSVLEFVPATAG